jgi:hypothetical protein
MSLRAGLARIEKHPTLAGSPRLLQLLRYLFEQSLAGRGEAISQYSIAFDCYRIGKEFDSSTNSLIRSHARRLRKILSDLGKSGAGCPIIMEERGYRLTFLVSDTTAAPLLRRPVLGIAGFEPAFAAVNGPELARALVAEIFMVAQDQDLIHAAGPFARPVGEGSAKQALEVMRRESLDFLLEGRVEEEAGQVEVGVRLIDGRTGHQVWANRYPLTPQRPLRAELADLARTIGTTITADWGIIACHRVAAALTEKNARLCAYEAVVLARQYLTNFHFEHLGRIVETLRVAARESEDVAVPATLAVLLSIACGVEPRWQGTLDKAEIRELGSRAARLDPCNPWTRLALAFSAMFDGRRAELLEMGRRVAREPASPLMLVGAFGTALCNQALELDLGRQLIRRYCAESAHYPRLVHLALALAALSEGNTRGAREELANFGVPWGWASPLILATCFALEGDAPKARLEWQRVLDAFPDFPSRWRETVATQWHASYLDKIFGALRAAGIQLD